MAAIHDRLRAICEQLEPRRLLAADVPTTLDMAGPDEQAIKQPLADVQAGAYEVLAPYSLSADSRPGAHASINLNWNSDGYRQYTGVRTYYRLKGESAWAVSEIAQSDALSCAFNATDWGTPLSPGKTYQFYVTNYIAEFESAPSNVVEAKLQQVTIPPTPQKLAVKQTSDTSAKLTWKLPTDRKPKFFDSMMMLQVPALLPFWLAKIKQAAPVINGFNIYREDDGSYIGQAPAKARSFNLTGLIPGESHQYWVKARRFFETTHSAWTDESEASNVVELTA